MRTGGTSYQRDRVCHVGILGEGGGERTFKYRSYATVEHTLAEEVLLLVALGEGHGGLCNVYRVVCERCDGWACGLLELMIPLLCLKIV